MQCPQIDLWECIRGYVRGRTLLLGGTKHVLVECVLKASTFTYVVEPALEAARRLRKMFPGLFVVWSDYEDTQITGLFDTVIVDADDGAAMEIASRRTAPGGKLVLLKPRGDLGDIWDIYGTFKEHGITIARRK